MIATNLPETENEKYQILKQNSLYPIIIQYMLDMYNLFVTYHIFEQEKFLLVNADSPSFSYLIMCHQDCSRMGFKY